MSSSAESSPRVSQGSSASSLPEAKRPIISQKKWHDRTISWIKENKGTILKVAIVVAAVLISLAFPSLAIFALPVGAIALATLLISKKDVQKVMEVAKDFFKAKPKGTPYKDAEKNVNYLKKEGDKKITETLSIPVQVFKDLERLQGITITNNESTTHFLSENEDVDKARDFFGAIEEFCEGDRALAINIACLCTQGELADIAAYASLQKVGVSNDGSYFIDLEDKGTTIEIKIKMAPHLHVLPPEIENDKLKEPTSGPISGRVWGIKTITVNKEQLKNNDFSSVKKEVSFVPRNVDIIREPKVDRTAENITNAYSNNLSEFVDGKKLRVEFHKATVQIDDSPASSPRGEVSPISSPVDSPQGSDIKEEKAN